MTSSSANKRKLDDYTAADDDDDADFYLISLLFPSSSASSPNPATRMRKDEIDLPSTSFSASTSAPPPPPPRRDRIQFFVRTLSDRTLSLQADRTDTIESVLHKIRTLTGIPVTEQRLIYRGKQLQPEQTLEHCQIQNDAGLHLVGRMRSTGHPKSWQLVSDLITLIYQMLKSTSTSPLPPPLPTRKTIKSMLLEFLSLTPRSESETAMDHLQILLSSSVLPALVMLYMSPHKANSDMADDAIRHFVCSCKNWLCKFNYSHYARIVLELCKLLRTAAGSEDLLYGACRSSFGSMLEYECVEVGTTNGAIDVADISLFICELGRKVALDLTASAEPSSASLLLSLSSVQEFITFLVPVRKKIDKIVAFRGPLKLPSVSEGCALPSWYAEEVKLLHLNLMILLETLDKCLRRIDERIGKGGKQDGETGFVGWSEYLVLLKEVNAMSKLYKGAEELFWEKMRQRKEALCYLVVKFGKRSDDLEWILEHKEVTNFEVRRHLAVMMLPEVRDEYEELHEMLIDRSHLLAESFEYIGHAKPESLRAGLFMEFKNEEATGPGVLREWFFLVCQAIFDPQKALFVASPNDGRRFYPNPASKVDPLHLQYFGFSGRVIALALMHKVQVGIVFDRIFFLQLAGRPISLEDIRDADPYLFSGCKHILEMDPAEVDDDVLGLTFSHEVEELGSKKVVELCHNGRKIAVTSKNRKQYVDSLIQHLFVTSISEQVARFSQGFADIVSSRQLQKSFFKSLDPEDLDWMLHGSEKEISVEDWKAHTKYSGYQETDPLISWFWKTVGLMSAQQKKVLLFFWTSIKHLPVEGFGGLSSRLYIYKTFEPSDRLPSSHTCFYRLCLPEYPSVDVMQDCLRIISQEHVGCSFGTW